MVTEGQVPPDEFASNALEQFCNGIFTVFRLGQHAFDSIRSETTTRDIDRHWHLLQISTYLTLAGAKYYRRKLHAFKGG
jgi:hypothetical protein